MRSELAVMDLHPPEKGGGQGMGEGGGRIMYAQLVTSEGGKAREAMTPEEAAFQDRIDRGEKIDRKSVV